MGNVVMQTPRSLDGYITDPSSVWAPSGRVAQDEMEGPPLPTGDPEPADPQAGVLLASGSLQSYGGAIAAVGENETGFGHRDALVEFVAVAAWTDPAQDQAQMAATRRYGAVVEPFASGVYVNDLTDEDQAGIRRAYHPGTLTRLAGLKDRYDPGNLFHLNHNIRPRKEQRR